MPNFQKQEFVYCIRLSKQVYQLKRILFYTMLTSQKNPEFPYWNYERLRGENKRRTECTAEFREDIYEVADQMKLLDEITT